MKTKYGYAIIEHYAQGYLSDMTKDEIVFTMYPPNKVYDSIEKAEKIFSKCFAEQGVIEKTAAGKMIYYAKFYELAEVEYNNRCEILDKEWIAHNYDKLELTSGAWRKIRKEA